MRLFVSKFFFDLRKVLAPENLRLEPENHPFEKEKSSSKPPFCIFLGEKLIFLKHVVFGVLVEIIFIRKKGMRRSQVEKHVFFLSKICLNRPRDKEPCAALLLGVVGGDGDLRRWGFFIVGSDSG